NSAPCGQCFFCVRQMEQLCDDLLFLNGAYAGSIVVPERIVRMNLLPLRSETGFADAALTEPLACVVHGVEETGLEPGQRLLVIGAGPIGLMFTRVAAHIACEVTVAGRGKARLEAARRMGAEVIAAGDDPDWWRPPGPDRRRWHVVSAAVGDPEVWEQAVQVVRKGGTVNFVGGCPAGGRVCLDTGLLHYSSLKLLASFRHDPRAVGRALQVIEKGVIRAE